jgi:hypothetical protein
VGRAAIYKKSGRLFVHSWSETTVGLLVFWEPVIALPEDCADGELNAAVRSALAASVKGVPHPDRPADRGLGRQMLKLAGEKTWNAFAKGASCVQVGEEAGGIGVTPTKNLGPRGGFAEDVPRKVTVPSGSDDLAATIRRCL